MALNFKHQTLKMFKHQSRFLWNVNKLHLLLCLSVPGAGEETAPLQGTRRPGPPQPLGLEGRMEELLTHLTVESLSQSLL